MRTPARLRPCPAARPLGNPGLPQCLHNRQVGGVPGSASAPERRHNLPTEGAGIDGPGRSRA